MKRNVIIEIDKDELESMIADLEYIRCNYFEEETEEDVSLLRITNVLRGGLMY